MKITIIGLGLIGGSMAIDLKDRKFGSKFLGVETSRDNAQKALDLGLVNEIVDLNDGIIRADLIIVATPVDVTIKLLPSILDKLENQIVMDVGSTKRQLLKSIETHPNRKLFVGTHPMAGTEFSGPEAAIPGLFDKKTTIICDATKNEQRAINLTNELYKTLKMNTIYMDSENHDVHVAYISHISHISSFALASTVMDIEKDEKNIFNLAGGGFESTVRLAKSSAAMWVPIFNQNKDNVLVALNNYIDKLQALKLLIKENKEKELTEYINTSNEIRRILDVRKVQGRRQ